MAAKAPKDARQTVLESAICEFAKKGYSGTSVQDVLSATGLSKPTLYYYFESKAGLFRAILEYAFDESLRRIEAKVDRAAGVRDRLIAVTAGVFEFAIERPELFRIVYSTAFAAPEEIPSDSLALDKKKRHFDFVRGVVGEGLKSRELDSDFSEAELAHGIYGAISHKTRMHLLCKEGKLNAASAARVVDLFLNGAVRRAKMGK
jgi:AcrR family transcriptional regulator